MSSKEPPTEKEQADQLIREAHQNREARETSYRDRALALFPHVCGRCGREFSGKKLRELTVHHRDHNHDNNPPDGSNWELLCLYCHDNEHSRLLDAKHFNEAAPSVPKPSTTFKPFAGLADLLKEKK
jgi:5-methylcytosine-specific restriction endonuclease McrA